MYSAARAQLHDWTMPAGVGRCRGDGAGARGSAVRRGAAAPCRRRRRRSRRWLRTSPPGVCSLGWRRPAGWDGVAVAFASTSTAAWAFATPAADGPSEVPQMLTQAGLRRVAPSPGAGSSGAGPPHDTPGAQRPRTAPGRAPPRSVGGPGSPFSLGQLLEHRLVQLRLRQKLLQPGILHLQLLEPPRVAGAHPRIGPAPATPDVLGGRLTAPSDDDGNREAPLNQVVSQSLRSATWHGYRSSVGLTGVRSTRRRRPQLAPQRRREEAPTQ